MKRKIFLLILIIVLLSIYKLNNQVSIIPDSAIRLRVIPNSNNPEDIYIKEKVKDYLEKDIYSLTKDTTSIEDARSIINKSIPTIENNINNIFSENDYNLPYQVNYGNNYFPEKTYQGITYEEGYYESLVISIGESKGDNFWCVLFPNFCLVDTEEEHTYKSYFKELLNKIF